MSEIYVQTHRFTDNFTIVPNSIINDTRLDLKERMYLIWALSLPPNWQLNTKSIAKILNLSKNTITRYNKKLKECEYLHIEKLVTGKTIWYFFQTNSDYLGYFSKNNRPIPSNTAQYHPKTPVIAPYPNNGDEGVQKTRSPNEVITPNGDVLVSTDLINKTIQEKDLVENEFDILYSAWPNTKNKKKSLSAFRTLCNKNSKQTPAFIRESLVQDIEKRLANKQFAFEQTMLSSYLNGERWKDGHDTTAVRKDPLLEAMGLT